MFAFKKKALASGVEEEASVPTTGAIAEGWFYFMANTQVDRFDKGAITPGSPLEPIRMLKIKL